MLRSAVLPRQAGPASRPADRLFVEFLSFMTGRTGSTACDNLLTTA